MLLRVVQYNVHRFLSGTNNTPTLSNIVRSLKQIRPDVLTLNECDTTVTPEAFTTLSTELNLPYVEFYGHVRERYGNAVLSRYPMTRKLSTPLRGGTSLSFPPGTLKLNGDISKVGETHRIVRGLLIVEIEHEVGPIHIGCTHLDHIDGAQRLIQLEHITESFQELNKEGSTLVPSILCGDLNALQREDYTDIHWAKLEQRAKDHQWNPPSCGDLRQLTSHGFSDCGSPAHDVEHPQYTAPTEANALYRIDYVWTKSTPLVAVNCRKHSPETSVAWSDHYPLVVDLELSAKVSKGSCKL